MPLPRHMKIPRLTGLILLVALLATLLGCQIGDRTDDASATPLLWQIEDENGDPLLYLFGSIHAAKPELYPLDDTITSAFDSCSYLAVECDIVDFEEHPLEAIDLMDGFFYSDGRTLEDELGEDLYLRTAEVLAHYEFDLEQYRFLKPAMISSLLASITVDEAGLDSEAGLDTRFLYRAKETGMTILEIESVEEQLALELDLSPELQILLLEESLDIEASAAALQELYASWMRGDEEELTALLTEESSEPLDPEMEALLDEYDNLLITDRNRRMIEAADRYLKEGKKTFYVVGLAHMLGDDGIVNGLRDLGYDVERIDY